MYRLEKLHILVIVGLHSYLTIWFRPFLGPPYAPMVETSFPEFAVISSISISNI